MSRTYSPHHKGPQANRGNYESLDDEIIRFFLEGKSNAEIAHICDVSERQVQRRLYSNEVHLREEAIETLNASNISIIKRGKHAREK